MEACEDGGKGELERECEGNGDGRRQRGKGEDNYKKDEGRRKGMTNRGPPREQTP